MRRITKKFINKVLDHPRYTLSALALITVIMGGFTSRIQFNFTIEQLFSQDDPLIENFLRFREEFDGVDNVVLLIYESDDPFSRHNLLLNRMMVNAFEEIEGISRVTGLCNIELFTEVGDFLLQQVYEEIPHSVDSLLAAKKRVLGSRLIRNYLVSEDGTLAAIIVQIDREYNYHKERERIIGEIDIKQNLVDWTWHQAGLPVIRTRYVQYMIQDNVRFALPIFGILVLFLAFLFRSWVGVAVPIATVIMADIWTLGLMAALDIDINIISYLIPTLLFIVGIGNSIHFLVKYFGTLQEIGNRRLALFQSIRKIGTAIFLTSLTTAIGFGSLSLVSIQIVKEFGLITAAGVFFAFIISILFIPSVLMVIEPTPSKKLAAYSRGFRVRMITRVIEFVRGYPRLIIISGIVTAIIGFFGAIQINPHSKLLEDLRPGDILLDDMLFAEEKMGAVLPIEIIVEIDENGPFESIQDLEILNFVSDLETFIASIPEVGKTTSVVDYLKEIHQAMFDGNPHYYRLPDNRETIAQYMLLYEGEFASFINLDYTKLRIAGQIRDIDSRRSMEMEEQIRFFIDESVPPGLKVEVTGTAFLALRTNSYLVKNLLNSFLLAFIVITIVMIFLFKSVKIALISILPNVIPILIMGAVMGYFGIPLRPFTAMTFAIAFGIAVDDTLHYLTRYRMELAEADRHYRQANDATLRSTGVAMISTTAILVSGFLVMTISHFTPTIQFGFLSAITILSALIGDLTFLPALLSQVRPNIKFKEV